MSVFFLVITLGLFLIGCVGDSAPKEPTGETLDTGLMAALAVLEKGPDGKPVPQPARLGILTQTNGEWNWSEIEDGDSNVFHKAMVYSPREGVRGILTAGGTKAMLKLFVYGYSCLRPS